MTADHLMLLCLLFLPVAAAVVVPLLGPKQGDAVPWTSLAASVVVLLLALTLAAHFWELDRAPPSKTAPDGATLPTFHPEFVPGAAADRPHETTWTVLNLGPAAVQFF